MASKILGLTAEEIQVELKRIGQHCHWTLLEEKNNSLIFRTEFGNLTLTWSSLPPEQLGSFFLPRTQLFMEGEPTALVRLDEALRCLRAGG
ncbi:hypothetical protein SAMN02745885_02425 [Carboxydocella sporoproducens DSM 16521]|uniref:Uncharacterized protein n=2 Tax=Carboxydocella TaxID=178898 RepID=A0A1T4S4X0_9FIRM|nr:MULTISPECIES: hypothetical protein [Carboxydocella]AVX21199.1 hypothetical protein CFE_2033 [Carboxydocella thermautotrophica]AVX31633.1 hypothetical protein CTH_2068 [Carboxydocella thermautotrophica]SKA22978.1 hypothetical protein SAMN02745885_02425 [Carboxydocella sporoproducens DSM 16521]